MKKNILIIILVFIFAMGLIACGERDTNKTNDNGSDDLLEEVVFDATVIDASGLLLVTPVEGSSELRSADKISVSIKLDDTSDYKAGDLVRITYDGRIAESYPAQIWASKIEPIGRNMIIDGHLVIIDDIYNEDSALNDSINIIAIDTSGWESISEAEIDILINILEEEYDQEIIEATREELIDMELIDEEEIYFKEGIFIEIKNFKYNDSTYKISATISKWRSAKGAIGWDLEAEFKDKGWEIKKDMMWIS